MEFNEKFSALLALTSVKGNSLAKAINIDSAQISRFRTGARKMPGNPAILRDISNYLSSYFDSGYRMTGLFELTGDQRLHTDVTQLQIADIIYTYLTNKDPVSSNKEMHRFLNRINNFLPNSPEVVSIDSEIAPSPFANTDLISYQKNLGKRQALLRFFSFLLSRGTPCAIYIFSDESDVWLLEDEKFSRQVASGIKEMTERGYKFIRVQPPSQNIESSFRDIERWLPAYMAGSLKMFFYPWARDELHRRTILVVPNVIAFYSASLYGMKDAEMTFVATERGMTNSFNAYFNDIVRRCRSVMSVYTVSEKDQILSQIRNISMITDNGVYKSHCLSAHTIPKVAHDSMRKRASVHLSKVFDCYEEAEQNKIEVMSHFTITDILCLPNYKDVLAGTEPIPGTIANSEPLYYTTEEYIQHVESIINYLETYPNYHVVLLDSSELDNVVIYTKGNHHVLLIKESDPFALFEVTEQSFAVSLVSYLNTLTREKSSTTSRSDIVTRLRQEVGLIKAKRMQIIS